MANLLVDNGADPHEVDSYYKKTPMQTLFDYLFDPYVVEIVRSFVERGLRLDEGRNVAFRLKECIASSEFLQDEASCSKPALDEHYWQPAVNHLQDRSSGCTPVMTIER